MKFADRIEKLPPYLLAQISKKVAAKKAQGIDVISFGIRDPDPPTPPHIIDALSEAARDPPTPPAPHHRCSLLARPRPRQPPLPGNGRPPGLPALRQPVVRPPLRRLA